MRKTNVTASTFGKFYYHLPVAVLAHYTVELFLRVQGLFPARKWIPGDGMYILQTLCSDPCKRNVNELLDFELYKSELGKTDWF